MRSYNNLSVSVLHFKSISYAIRSLLALCKIGEFERVIRKQVSGNGNREMPNLASTLNADTKYGVPIFERLNGETGRGRNIDFAEAIGFLANVRHLSFPSAGLCAERVVVIARLKACYRRLSRRKVKRSGKVLHMFVVSSFDCGKCFGGVCAAGHISPQRNAMGGQVFLYRATSMAIINPNHGTQYSRFVESQVSTKTVNHLPPGSDRSVFSACQHLSPLESDEKCAAS